MATKPKPPATTPHTHAITATAKWSAFKAAMLEHATQTQAERDRVDRDRMQDTDYYKQEHPT